MCLSICAYNGYHLSNSPNIDKGGAPTTNANNGTKISNIVGQRHIYQACYAYIIRGDATTSTKHI
jgi:hypothetical protein